jgi:hypothetical protein
VRFCCRAERPTPAHRHASDSVFSSSPPETYTACPSAFLPRSGGWKASDRYCADGGSSSLFISESAEALRAPVR